VLGVGCKTPVSGRFARGANRLLEGYQAWLDDQVGHLPLRKRLKQWTIGRLRSKGERRRLAAWHQCRFALQMPARSWFAGGNDRDVQPAMAGSRLDLIGE
jgi:hypothetical protein